MATAHQASILAAVDSAIITTVIMAITAATMAVGTMAADTTEVVITAAVTVITDTTLDGMLWGCGKLVWCIALPVC